DRSDTGVLAHSRFVSFMSFSGDRSDTCVLRQDRNVSFMSFIGERSVSFPPSGLPLQMRYCKLGNARTGEMSVTLTDQICNPVTTPNSSIELETTLPSTPGLRSRSLSLTAFTCCSAGSAATCLNQASSSGGME